MISAEYCRLMARYNTWQNVSLATAADGLTHVDRWKDRGAFFQSIAATLNHIYWADALMLQRLKGNERPEETIKHSLIYPSDWDDFKTLRLQRNEEIEEWAARLLDADLNGMVVWYRGMVQLGSRGPRLSVLLNSSTTRPTTGVRSTRC
jgi:uncharacterized damage-inducible protein DinB